METKGVTCKIPLDLHNRISEEIRETESTMSCGMKNTWEMFSYKKLILWIS